MAQDDTTQFRIPKASNLLAGIVAASLLPTGGAGVLAKYVSGVSDKLDAVISRLDKIEGAGIQAKVEDLEKRTRSTEEELVKLQVLVQSRGGR